MVHSAHMHEGAEKKSDVSEGVETDITPSTEIPTLSNEDIEKYLITPRPPETVIELPTKTEQAPEHTGDVAEMVPAPERRPEDRVTIKHRDGRVEYQTIQEYEAKLARGHAAARFFSREDASVTGTSLTQPETVGVLTPLLDWVGKKARKLWTWVTSPRM
jgi:hypothetical protein